MLNTLCQPIHCSAVGPTTKLVTWPIWQWILASQALPIFPVCSLWQWQWCQVLKLLPFTQSQVQHPIIGDVRYDHWPGLQLKALPTFPSVNSVAVAMMPSAWLMIHVPTIGTLHSQRLVLGHFISFSQCAPCVSGGDAKCGCQLGEPTTRTIWVAAITPTNEPHTGAGIRKKENKDLFSAFRN